MRSLKEQNKILKKYFKIEVDITNVPINPKGTVNALVPHWNKIGKTYNDAVEKVFKALKKERSFYNYRDGKLSAQYLRQTERKANIQLPEILSVQLGEKNKGKSVETVRKEYSSNEVGLGAYEMGMIILLNDDVLTKYEDLWLDCPGDEYSYDGDGAWSRAPYFGFYGGEVRFDTGWLGFADEECGSGSAILTQSILESSTLEPIESLTLETAMKMVKEAGYQISKII